jgi:hypothetical protein
MSAMPPKADIRLTVRHDRLVPIGDIPHGSLFDHFVGADEYSPQLGNEVPLAPLYFGSFVSQAANQILCASHSARRAWQPFP